MSVTDLFCLDKMREASLHRGLARLSKPDVQATSLAFFTSEEIKALIDATKFVEFRQATKVVGNGVIQDMEVCFPAPRTDVFDICATLLEEGLNRWPEAGRMFDRAITLNDFAIQKYPAGSEGIGIHKDGLRYKNIVLIITLAGQSRLFKTQDRDGTHRVAINDVPGRLVMIKAPGFQGMAPENRLLHGVDRVTKGRLSIGFRQEVLPQG